MVWVFFTEQMQHKTLLPAACSPNYSHMICHTQLQGEVDIVLILESHVPVKREGSDWKKMSIFYFSCSYEAERILSGKEKQIWKSSWKR